MIYISESDSMTSYIYSDGIIDKTLEIKNFSLNENKKSF